MFHPICGVLSYIFLILYTIVTLCENILLGLKRLLFLKIWQLKCIYSDISDTWPPEYLLFARTSTESFFDQLAHLLQIQLL